MKILKNLDLNSVLIFDIETANVVPQLEKDTLLYDSWVYKMKHHKAEVENGTTTYEELYKTQGALYPEFAKIVCISIGKITENGELKVKSYYSHDEKELLINFNKGLNALLTENKQLILGGFNIKGFDIPFILRRCMVNEVEPSSLIDTGETKPWLVTAVDVAEVWKAGGINSASLLNIAIALGLKNPKERMYNYETSEMYYQEGGLEKIKDYCVDDLITTANVIRKCRFEPLVKVATLSKIEPKKVGLVEEIYNTKTTNKKLHGELQKRFESLDESEVKAGKAITELVTPKTKK